LVGVVPGGVRLNNPNVIGGLEEKSRGSRKRSTFRRTLHPMSETTNPTEDARAALRARMAGHVEAALACLGEIADPVERERAARVLADDLLPDAGRRVKAVRSAAVRELRRELKLREVSELTGLSIPRIDQLAKGR
jgi:hypothetical protein